MKIFSIFTKSFSKLSPRKIFKSKSFLIIVLFIIVIVIAAYFYDQNRKAQTLLLNPTQVTENETNKLINEIGVLMVLPEGEKPTLISVVDKEKVKGQPFFAKAENGDKVLVYTAAKKAILFRPSTNKIIEIGPVDIAPEKNFTIALYDSTSEISLLDSTEKSLAAQVTNLEFPIKEKISYSGDKTIVVDLIGDKKTEADQLAKLLGGVVSTLPDGIKKSATDFLIILVK